MAPNPAEVIPADWVANAAPGNVSVAKDVAQRVLDAVEIIDKKGHTPASVQRMRTASDVQSFRIDIEGSPFHSTITEYSVIEAYEVEKRRTASGRRRTEMMPVLVEVTHIFTVQDQEGVVLSVSDAVPVMEIGKDPSVFARLFEAARSTNHNAVMGEAVAHSAA